MPDEKCLADSDDAYLSRKLDFAMLMADLESVDCEDGRGSEEEVQNARVSAPQAHSSGKAN